MLAPRPVGYGLNPSQQEEEDGLQFVDVLKQLAGGFVQGFTTIDIVEEEPDHWLESLAQGAGYFAGFVGIIPGLGTAVSFGTKAGVRGVSGGIKLLGGVVGREAAESVVTKGMQGLRYVTQPNVQKYYTQTRSVPMYAADLIMGMGKKALAGTPAEALAKKVLMGPAGKRVVVQDIAEAGIKMGLASGVSAWQGGIDQMMYSFAAGAAFGGADRGVANMLGGLAKDSRVVRAIAGMAVNGLPSTLMDQPLEIQVFDYITGAWFGTELPYAQRKALEALTGPSSVTADGKRRYEAWLNPEENIPEYVNAEQLYGDQADNVRKEIVNQSRMWLGSGLGNAYGAGDESTPSSIVSQLVAHSWFKNKYDQLVPYYQTTYNMTEAQAHEAALDAIRKSPQAVAVAKTSEEIDLRIKNGEFDVDPLTGQVNASAVNQVFNEGVKQKVPTVSNSKKTAADNITSDINTVAEDQDPVAKKILDVAEETTVDIVQDSAIREDVDGMTMDRFMEITDTPDRSAIVEQEFQSNPDLEAQVYRDLGLGRQEEGGLVVSSTERDDARRSYADYISEVPDRDRSFKEWLDDRSISPEVLLGQESTQAQKAIRSEINGDIEQPEIKPIPEDQINPDALVAADILPYQTDPTLKRISKTAIESTDTGRIDDNTLIDNNVKTIIEDGYTGDINPVYVNRVSPVDYVARTIVSSDDTIPALQKEARYNEILSGIRNDYDLFMADGVRTPYDFAVNVINKYSANAKIDPIKRDELVGTIVQASRKMMYNQKVSQVVVDPVNKRLIQTSDKSTNGTPISVSKAPSHLQRRLAEFESNVQSIRLFEEPGFGGKYTDPDGIFNKFDSADDMMWIHHQMLENGKAFMGHVKSNGELVYYDMFKIDTAEALRIQQQIKDAGLEKEWTSAREEYVNLVTKQIEGLNPDAVKDLYDQYVVSQVKLFTDVLNPKLSFNDVVKSGFVNDFLKLNKRMQLIHGEGQWADSRYFADIDDLDNEFKFIILSSRNKNNLTKREGIDDDTFNVEKDGIIEEQKSEASTDGAVIVRSDVFDRMVRDGGYDSNAGVIKSIVTAHDESGLGMLLSKHAMFRAGQAQDAFLKQNGLHMILRDTSAKQSGKRKIFDSQLANDGTLNIYEAGTTNLADVKNATYTMPIESVSYNLGTKETVSGSLENQVLVTQLLGNLHDSKVPNDFIKEIFDEYNGKAIRGDQKENERLDVISNDLVDVNDDAVGRTKASKINVEKLGVNEIVDVLYNNKGGKYVYDRVIRHILKSNIKQDPTDYIAESEFMGKDLSGTERIILSMPDNFVFTGAFIANRNVNGYVSNKIRSYVNSKIHTPEMDYSAKAIGLPTDEFNRGLVKQGEFMLGQSSRAMKVKSRAFDKNTTLGDLWDTYQAELAKDAESKLTKDLEFDLRMVVVRVPSDSISGARSLLFKGFYDNRGTGIALHSEDMAYMGGMDLDIDSTFIYQDLGKNKYGKAQQTLHDVLLANKDQWVKQVGDKKVIIDSKNNEGAKAMGVEPVPSEYKNAASLFNIRALTTVGLNATKGKQAVGSAASARTDIASWYSVAENVVKIPIKEVGKLKLPTGIKRDDVVEIQSVKKDSIKEFDAFARQAMNYAADSADNFNMIRPTQISNMLWGKAFDTYAVLKNGRRVLLDQPVKPKKYSLFKDALDSTNTFKYSDDGVKQSKNIYEYLYTFRTPEGVSDFKSRKALEASQLNVPDPDIFSMTGLAGWDSNKYDKLISSYKKMYTEKGVTEGDLKLDAKQKSERAKILRSFFNFKSINSPKEVSRISESISKKLLEIANPDTPAEKVLQLKQSVSNQVDYARQLLSQDISDVTTAMMLVRQAEDVMDLAKGNEAKKEKISQVIATIANQADSFKKAYAKASSEVANNQGKNKGEVVDALQLEVANYRNNVLQSQWQRKMFDTYMLGTFNVQNTSDIDRRNFLAKQEALTQDEQLELEKLNKSIFANNANTFGAFLKATGLENTAEFYKAYSDISENIVQAGGLNKNRFLWMYKKIGTTSADIKNPNISNVDDLLVIGKNESLESIKLDEMLSSSEQKNDIDIDKNLIRELSNLDKEQRDMYKDCIP